MKNSPWGAVVFGAVGLALIASGTARAASVYVGLGDSITFGETDLRYVPSFGDRGYVGKFADILAAQNGGIRPAVVNLAIDGETAAHWSHAARPRANRYSPGATKFELQQQPHYVTSSYVQQLSRFSKCCWKHHQHHQYHFGI